MSHWFQSVTRTCTTDLRIAALAWSDGGRLISGKTSSTIYLLDWTLILETLCEPLLIPSERPHLTETQDSATGLNFLGSQGPSPFPIQRNGQQKKNVHTGHSKLLHCPTWSSEIPWIWYCCVVFGVGARKMAPITRMGWRISGENSLTWPSFPRWWRKRNISEIPLPEKC